MATLPSVPPVADADRYVAYTPGGVPTASVSVPFPIYGDASDLKVLVDGKALWTGAWSLASASGAALASIAQPVTDGQIMFFPSVSATTIEVVGSIHPRQTSMPSAPGIARREFNYTVGYILSALREVFRSTNLLRAQPYGFDASGPLASRSQYDLAAQGFRFAQTDDATGRPILYVKLSGNLADWSQAMSFQGAQGVQGAPGPGTVQSVATGYGLKGGPITTTGTIQVDTSSLGLGMRNRLLNGGMAIDQRNVGAAVTLGVASGVSNYVLDRWYSYLGSTGTGISAQRVSVLSGGINYACRLARANGSSTVSVINHVQVLETAQCVDLQGKNVTLSVAARAGANFSGSGGALNYSVSYGTGTDQSAASFVAGTWTGQAVINSGQILPTPSGGFLAGSINLAVPANATQLAVRLWWTPVGTAGAADYVDVSLVQLEIGTIAAADVTFEFRAPGAELALCQRFFSKSYPQSIAVGGARGAGGGGVTIGTASGSVNVIPAQFPQVMRSLPAMTTYDNAGTAGKVSYYAAGTWSNGLAATNFAGSDLLAQVTYSISCNYVSFDWSANAEL